MAATLAAVIDIWIYFYVFFIFHMIVFFWIMGFLNVSTVFDHDSFMMLKRFTSYLYFKKKNSFSLTWIFIYSISILLLNTIWFNFFDHMMWKFWYMFSQCCLFFSWFYLFVNDMLLIIFIWFLIICKWFFKYVL